MMKKALLHVTCMIFLLCALLTACGGKHAEKEEQIPLPQEEVEEPKLLSQTELETLFQKILDSDGDIQSRENEQIKAELATLRTAADMDVMPEDYEDLYKSWREERVSAWEEEIEQLKEEYKKIVLMDADILAAWNENRDCYAYYVDFDGNGIPELLVLAELEYNDFAVKVYGSNGGEITALFDEIFTTYTESWVRLYQDNKSPAIYLGVYTLWQSAKMWGAAYEFYALANNEWRLTDDLANGVGGWDEEVDPYDYWRSFDKDITEEEYAVRLSRYTDYQKILDIMPGEPFPEDTTPLSNILSVTLTVNGEPIELGTQPFVENGAFMVPIRPVLEAMGVQVCASSTGLYGDYHNDEGPDIVVLSTKMKTCTIHSRIYLDDVFASYHPGDYYAQFNEYIYDDQGNDAPPPRIVDGQMVGPLSKMVQFFGGTVVWDAASRTLAVTGSIPEAERMSEEELKSMLDFSLDDAVAIIMAQGYCPVYEEPVIDSCWAGKKSWEFPVLPQGVEYVIYPESSFEPWYGPTNATCVTIKNDESILWGESYYKDIV